MKDSNRDPLRKVRYSNRDYLPVLIAVVAVMVSLDANGVHAQQSNLPPGIVKADTTFVGRADADVLNVLMKRLPSRGEGEQETVLENKLRQTQQILADRPVWFTINWPSVPTEVNLFVDDSDGMRVNRLLKLWNYKDGNLLSNRRCLVSFRSLSESSVAQEPSFPKWQPSSPSLRPCFLGC